MPNHLTPSEEEKLRQAVIRLKASSAKLSRLGCELGNVLSDIHYDATICGQFVTGQKAHVVAQRSVKIRREFNALELGDLMIKTAHLSEGSWDNRPGGIHGSSR